MALEEYWKIYSLVFEEGISYKEVNMRIKEFDENYAVALKKSLQPIDSEDTNWLKNALIEGKKKQFVRHIFYDLNFPLPKKLYKAMIRAAVYERDPSENQFYVYPCVKSYGCYVVHQSLLEYVKNGDNFEKAGAVNALYWAVPSLVNNRSNNFGKYSAFESVSEVEKFRNIWQIEKMLLMEEFLKNDNISVRRNIIGQLSLMKIASYPTDLRSLLDKVIEIARNHPDEYIRHRVNLLIFISGDRSKHQLFMALPDRSEENQGE